MKPSYDDTSVEPIVFPAKFPIILLNGSSGIGYTLSSDIYPYNLCEIANATIKLLKNPKNPIKLIPDSPTGCDIIVKDDETFIMQSSFDVDNVNYVITIKNTPYKRYLKYIHEKLCEIQDSNNPISEIISADDESDLIKEDNLRYVIRCKPCNLYNVINKLFKRVPGFRIGISTRNMLVVDSSFRTNKYSIKQILLSWIEERIKSKRTWFLRKLVSLTTEYNMLEGKAFMLSDKNLNKTIKIFHDCKHKQDIIPALVKAYSPNVSSSQANYMIEVKMYQLTHEEYEKTLKKIEEIKNKKCELTLDEQQKLIDELNEKVEILQKNISEITHKIEIDNKLIDVLGDEGLRMYFFKKLLPILNGKINHYLQKFELPVTLEFDSFMNETIKTGRFEQQYNQFSGGERSRIDMAILLSFFDISKIISNWSCSFLMIDEILDSYVDNDGLEKFMSTLYNIVTENDKNLGIYVISHKLNEMTLPYNELITITKKSLFSDLKVNKLENL
jgi:DNA gyrase/topoisomerase IV subunit A